MSSTGQQLVWQCRDRILPLGKRTLIMGVLNATPDSFSDGGQFADPKRAVARALQMAEEGADIIDIGGESTRPGAGSVSAEEELRRVLPVVEAVAKEWSGVISIDTTKSNVARSAIERGAHIINDISSLTTDPAMADVAKDTRCGVVLMHMKGTPRIMQEQPEYDDVVAEVASYLSGRVRALTDSGIRLESLVVDPGIGFGKTVGHNVSLLAGLPQLKAVGRPILIGVSRKSFLGKLTGRDVGDRLSASLGAMAYAVLQGADIVRVHDVKESCEVARVVDIIRQAE